MRSCRKTAGAAAKAGELPAGAAAPFYAARLILTALAFYAITNYNRQKGPVGLADRFFLSCFYRIHSGKERISCRRKEL
ncbi:MAG TPA: hypothetical protein IAB52_03320 [Candidatus Scatomonas merdavium]|nr:hypothetical protein [Candidatus Scatomonas merdavium]